MCPLPGPLTPRSLPSALRAGSGEHIRDVEGIPGIPGAFLLSFRPPEKIQRCLPITLVGLAAPEKTRVGDRNLATWQRWRLHPRAVVKTDEN